MMLNPTPITFGLGLCYYIKPKAPSQFPFFFATIIHFKTLHIYTHTHYLINTTLYQKLFKLINLKKKGIL